MSELSANQAAEEAPFLANEPPPLVARGLSWILISLFAFAVLLAAIVKLPETVVAPFVLVPVRGTDPIKAPRGGVVTQAFAAEGRTFTKGAALFTIRSDEILNRISERDGLESQLRGLAESLRNLRNKNEIEVRSAAEELRALEIKSSYLERLLKLKKDQLALTREQVDRAYKLAEQGLASFDERSEALIRSGQTAMELEQLAADVKSNESAIARLKQQNAARNATFLETERTTLEKEEQTRIKLQALENLPVEAGTGQLLISAPCDGTVFTVKVRGEGAVIREGDTLCEVACAGEKLQAEVNLPQEGSAKIQSGQPVKLLFEAFPYQRYGIKNGIVRWSSPAGITTGDKVTFPVYVQPEEQTILVDGKSRPYLAGMKGTARIVVGKRSVLSFAFGPLRQLQENLR
ncbi:MAG: HlyD family efflux transporter periplasmic adaptor subunit [Acidobacteria bacterium]|nr:HlyD family efflux transporter periplasmic adaptor subunit [Acidobacteriota bacterium]